MAEKNIKSRIIHKHDIEAHWMLAENFIPKQGEIIIYDIEIDSDGNTLALPEDRTIPYVYERFKIGDGKTLVSKLPFVDDTNIENGEAGKNSVQQAKDVESWATINPLILEAIEADHKNEDQQLPIAINEETGEILVGAFNKYASVWGGKSQAIGSRAHAEGGKTIAFESAAHSEGTETFAAGKHSHAEGNTTSALGNSSHAQNKETIAQGDFSHAEGLRSHAEGEYTHAEGVDTLASGKGSHSEGYGARSIGIYSHAEGHSTKTEGDNSHAEGSETNTVGDNSHSEGRQTYAGGNNSHAEGYQAKAYGDNSHAEGNTTTAKGVASHAMNNNTTATGDWSSASGNETQANGMGSDAGGQATVADGDFSFTRNSYNKATARDASAFGSNTVAGDTNAFSTGGYTVAGNVNTHSEGGSTMALAPQAHAENYKTIAGVRGFRILNSTTFEAIGGLGDKCLYIEDHIHGLEVGDVVSIITHKVYRDVATVIALNEENNAIALGSFKEDVLTETGKDPLNFLFVKKKPTIGNITYGYNSHAEGDSTIAVRDGQHVQGKFNKIDTDFMYADIVGNGTSEDNRSNAYALDWDGNAYYAGDVYSKGNSKLVDSDEFKELKDYAISLETYMLALEQRIIALEETLANIQNAEEVSF